MGIKQTLIELLAEADAAEQGFLAGLTEDQRLATGTLARWSAKDMMAHVAEWNALMAAMLAAARGGQAPPDFDHFDRINAGIFERYRDATWDEVQALRARASAELLAELEALPEEALPEPGPFPWQAGRPLWRDVAASGYTHPLAHLAAHYLQMGERATAGQLAAQLAQRLPALDDSPGWRGIATYNLACFYAQSGQAERAITALDEALQLNPDLVEWSREDPDLAPLRELPAYRALYAS